MPAPRIKHAYPCLWFDGQAKADGGNAMRCGWMSDRFGVTWQIIPEHIGEWLSHPETGAKCTEAMMGMVKLDIEKLRNP